MTEAFAVLQKGERDVAVFRVSVCESRRRCRGGTPWHARFGWSETAVGWQALPWMQPVVLDVRSPSDEWRSGVVIRVRLEHTTAMERKIRIGMPHGNQTRVDVIFNLDRRRVQFEIYIYSIYILLLMESCLK